MRNLFILLFFLLINSYAHADTYECEATAVYPDPQLSVEKIVLNFPGEQLDVVHRDMALEVVNLFTPFSATAHNWKEMNKDYFLYTMNEAKIDFSWGTQHYGELYREDKGTLKGQITLLKRLDFLVTCQKIRGEA